MSTSSEVREGVFYLPFEKKPGAPSHHIHPTVPKPSPERILSDRGLLR